jgi:hypothetical protein
MEGMPLIFLFFFGKYCSPLFGFLETLDSDNSLGAINEYDNTPKELIFYIGP